MSLPVVVRCCGLSLAACALAAVFAPPVQAFVARSGNVVAVSEAISDDLYAAGGTVTVAGTVDGDVAATGGTVQLDARVAGSVLAAGGTVRVAGQAGRSLRAAAGTLDVAGNVGTDAVLAGGTVTVGSGTGIGRDLVVAGANVNIAGNVERNLRVGGGEVILGAAVRGDAEIHARRLILLPTTRIGGRLRYSADQPLEVQSGAEVTGGIERAPGPVRQSRRFAGPGFWIGMHVLEMLALIALGLVAFGVASRGAAAVAREVADRFGRSLLAGFILLVVVPAAAFVLLFTIVGIPLSIVMMLLYFATLYPAEVFVAAWLGDRLVRLVSRDRTIHPSVYLALVIGSVVLVLLFAIPFLGWVLRFVAVLVGFGALWVTVWTGVSARPARVSPAQAAS